MSIGNYGCRVSTPDKRDYKFLLMEQTGTTTPAVISLRDVAPSVLDQENIGSCVSNSLGNVFKYHLTKDNVSGEKFEPSRLEIYFQGRTLEGTVNSDSGLTVADGCKVLHQFGACAEHEWPYDTTKYLQEPPLEARVNATHRKVTKYMRVQQNVAQIKGALALKLPVTIGISVYESFESDSVAKTGTVPMPQSNEAMLGGHCVTIWGADDNQKLFTLQNSWGPNWGDEGFFTLPYEYVLDSELCFELWCIQLEQRVG